MRRAPNAIHNHTRVRSCRVTMLGRAGARLAGIFPTLHITGSRRIYLACWSGWSDLVLLIRPLNYLLQIYK